MSDTKYPYMCMIPQQPSVCSDTVLYAHWVELFCIVVTHWAIQPQFLVI